MKHSHFGILCRSVATAIVVIAAPLLAAKRTVNPGTGADYVYLDSALSAINRNALTVDTLLIAGADQTDTLNWSYTMTRTNQGSLVLLSTAANPDSFPVIRRTGTTGWDFFKNTNVAFENVQFSNAKTSDQTYAWTNAQSSSKTHRFKNCVIKNQNEDYFFNIEGETGTTIIFENCLFEGNSKVFTVNYWNSGAPTLSIINCTFDNNTEVIHCAQCNLVYTNISIKNCIFSNNASIYPSASFKGKTAYSLTSEPLTDYGTSCVSSSNPQYKSSTRSVPSDWLITFSPTPSPAIDIGNSSGAPAGDLSGYARIGNPDAGCWEVHPRDFTWDASASTGIQGGNGNWGGPSAGIFWTYDNGATRIAWLGAGNSATFGGSDGAYTITIAGTQYVDSLAFLSDGYTLSGGTITFTASKSVVVAAGKTGIIESALAGLIGLQKLGGGTLRLVGANSYTGATTIVSGTLSTANLAIGGATSGIGSSDAGAANLLVDGGELSYIGAAQTCDRLFTVGAGGAAISASGIGTLVLSNAGPVAFSGSGARTVTLSGSNTGNNTFAPAIGDAAAATSLVKSGAGTWLVTGANTYTGPTTVTAGKLIVTGSTAASAVTVTSGATLGGTGSLGGGVAINGSLAPGQNGTGKLTISNNLAFSSTGSYECAIDGATAGTEYDQLVVTGTVALGNASLALTLGYSPIAGQSYTIIDNDGTDAVTGTFSGLPEGKRIILSFNGTSYYCSITYRGGTGNDVVLLVASVATDYFWDFSQAPGFQGQSGVWGTGADWSADGITLITWPGAGNTATFAGIDSVYTVSVSGVESVDSLTFLSGGYTLSGGIVNLGTHGGIHVAPAKSATIASVIDGSGGLSKYGSGSLVLSGTNTFSGAAVIGAGTLQLGIGGETGSVSGPIDDNGALIFNRSNSYIFSSAITGNGAITKTGTGALKLTATNPFTGALTVSAGSLVVNGTLSSGCNVTVGSAATLGGAGSCGGAVVASGAIVAPGDDGPGKLTAGSLSLSGASKLNFDVGGQNDTIAVTGNLSLSGTFNLFPRAGFSSGSYTLITCSGTITNNTPVIGAAPAGKGYALIVSTHAVTVRCTTAIITTQPRDTAVVIGKSCSFSLAASGTGTLSYQWIKEPSIVSGTGPSLSLGHVSIADSGRYRCIVADSFGIDTSRWVSLSIIVPPHITSQPVADTVLIGDRAQFRLAAAGTAPLAFTWHKSLISADSVLRGSGDSLVLALAAFSDSGDYYCIVSNPGGADTSKTVRLVVRYIAPTRAKVTPDSATVFTGDTVRFSVAAAGTAPFTYEWHKISAGSDSLAGARDTLGFFPATLVDNGKYFCIVRNPGGADTSDTARLTVRHIPPRNAAVHPDSATVYPGAHIRFVVTAEGTRPFTYAWFKVRDAKDSALAAPDDTLRIDSAALSQSGTYYCIVVNPGGADTSKAVSLTVSTVPPSGAHVRPDTSRIIAGQALTLAVTVSGALPLTYAWHKVRNGRDSLLAAVKDSLKIISATLSDSGIYYCIVSNPGGADTSNPAALYVRTMPPSAALIKPDTAVVFIGQAAVFHASVSGSPPFTFAWYKVRNGDDSLLGAAGDSLKIISATRADSGTYYYIVGNKGGTDTSGFSRLFVRSRAPKAGFSFTPKSGTAPLSVVFSDASSGEISTRLWKFGDDSSSSVVNPTHTFVKPGRYTVMLIATGPGGVDSLRKQDSVSVQKDTGISQLMQPVAYFDSAATRDTVRAFDGKVVLWKDSTYTVKTLLIDTLQLLKPGTTPKGMIVVGSSVVFRKASAQASALQASATQPFFIGIRIDSLPIKKSIGDVRIYTDSAENLLVNYATMIDSANTIAFVKTADLRWPFLALIDTATPRAQFQSDTASYAASGAKLVDTLTISDNIANVQWQYFYGRGDEAPRLQQQNGSSYRTGNRIELGIADTSDAISSESGLRAFLRIIDGVHTDTINMSRSVVRKESDKQTVAALQWTPVYPTAKLFSASGDSLVSRLSKSGALTYDPRAVRLFRWVQYEGNKNDAEKWIEYDPKRSIIRALFTLEPGTLVWLKTRDTTSINLASGVTLSLKDTLQEDLPAGQWSDFGMPYRFGVMIERILSASGRDADSLLFFRWKRDEASPLFFLEPVYVPGMPDNLDASKTIEYTTMGGYSIFNRSSKTITMRVPPIPVAMEKKQNKTAKRNSRSWSAKFVAIEHGSPLPAVYFGYAPGSAKSAYPLSPSFSSLRLSVFDRRTAAHYGHHIGEDARYGLIRELLISNDADTARKIRFHLEKVGNFPETYTASCFDAAAKKFETEGAITVAPKSVASRWVVIGDAAFQKRFITSVMSLQFALHSPYPNPARSAINIRYSVPFGAEERIRIAVYSIQGKKVWEKRIDGLLVEGEHSVTWNSNGNDRRAPAPSGLYIVRLTAVDRSGKAVKQFEQRVTLMK